MTKTGNERLLEKLHKDTTMPESAIKRFLELRNEIDGLYDKVVYRTAPSTRAAINRRYDEQGALLNKYRQRQIMVKDLSDTYLLWFEGGKVSTILPLSEIPY